MREYHKIETLFKFNQETKRFNFGEIFNPSVEILKNNQWIFTEKIDGTNLRIVWDGHKLNYGGRTENSKFNKKEIDFIMKNLVNEDIQNIFEQTFREIEVYVYGELYGDGIQNGGLYTEGKGFDFRVFDIEIGGTFLTFENAVELSKGLCYKTVPYVLNGTIDEALDFVMSNEKSTFSQAKLEGLVGKPVGDFRDRLGKRIVIKIKKRDLR